MSLAASIDFQPKLIYLARRNPALSRGDFVLRWRQHAALGMSRPRWRNIARYVHCDVLHPHSSPASVEDAHDGIGLIWHRSADARAAHLADTSSRLQMEQDEAETFREPIVNCCLVAREQVLHAPPPPIAGTVKLTRFWRPGGRESLTLAGSGGAAGSALMREHRHIIGHVINVPLPPERGDCWGLRCSVVEELWFSDQAAALGVWTALTTTSDGAAATTVMTNEVLLYSS